MLALAGIVGGVAVVVGAPWWGEAFYENRLGALTPQLAVFLGSTLLSTVLEVIFIARQRAGQAAIVYCVSDLAMAALVLGTVLADGGVAGILEAVTFVQGARIIALVLYARLARVGAQDQIRDTLGNGIRLMAVACLPLFVLLELVAGDVIVLLYTQRFADAVPVFRVSLLALPLLATQLEYVPRAYGDTRFLFLMCAIRGVVCVGCLTVLPQTFGLPGAPLAFILALVASHLVLLVRVSRLTGLRYVEVWPLGMLGRILAASLASDIPVVVLKSIGLLAFWPVLATASVAFEITYGMALWRLQVLSGDEKEAVRALVRRLAVLGGFLAGREALGGRPR